MQSVAAWLVSRPQNGCLGLFITLLLPFSQIFSGAVLVLLLLHNSITQSLTMYRQVRGFGTPTRRGEAMSGQQDMSSSSADGADESDIIGWLEPIY